MYQVKITKTLRRKIAEAAVYFWGVAGLIICFYMARQALEIDLAGINSTGRPSIASLPVMMYTLIWIGGLVFTGFFATFAPVEITFERNVRFTLKADVRDEANRVDRLR